MYSISRFLLVAAVAWFGVALTSSSAVAQETGTLTGVVVDEANGESLPGANVTIAETSTGTATDLNGRYRITGLEPGTYDVVFSFIGFAKKTITGVEITAGETTKLDVTLAEQTAELDEVVVEAAVAKDSEAGILKKRQKASAVSDAISAELISQSGAGDAAEALKKVTGASIEGGKYVVVRGLGSRYSNTQLNGSQLPSSDPDRKSVQLDLFPADLLDNIVTTKTFTPDQPGNFSGGLVNINTKSFPESFSMSVSSSVTLNTAAHFNDGFLSYPGGGTDWIGFDDGTRSLPGFVDGLSRQDIPGATEARLEFQDGNPELAQRLDRASKSFNNAFGPTQRIAPINHGFDFSLGNQTDVGGRPLGYVAGFTYSRSASFYENGQTGRYSVQGGGDNSSGTLVPEYLVDDMEGTESTSIGGVLNLSYKITPNNQISFNNFYTHDGESRSRLQNGVWPDEFDLGTDPRTVTNRALFWTGRDLYSGQLRGEHLMSALGGSTIEWTGTFAVTRQEQPDLRFFFNTFNPTDGEYSVSSSNFNDPARLYRDLTEDRAGATLNYTLPFNTWAGKTNVKVGGAYSYSTRGFEERFFSFDTSRFNRFDGDEERFFSEENLGIREVDGNTPVFGITLEDQTRPENQYDGERTVGAGYAMIDIPITKRLQLITGARLELTNLSIDSRAAEELAANNAPDSVVASFRGEIETADILPSLNLKYQVRDDMNLRFAATRTLARPTFREVAPFASFNFLLDNFISGNPQLDRTLIDNLDLRWEWFTRPSEIFAISLFFKRLQDPIERAVVGGTNGQITWVNVDEALVYGAEFEARLMLDRFTDALEHFTLGSNLSLIESQIDIPEDALAERRAVFGADAGDTRELQGQSPYTFNADLSYGNPESGTNAAVSFNVSGERLASITRGGTPDVFESPRPQLNASLSQSFLRNWEVKLGAENLLNSKFEEVYTFGDTTVPFQAYQDGVSFSLGLTYSVN